MNINISRRTFLKGVAGGAAVLAVAGTTGGYLMAKPKPKTGPLPGNKIAKLQFVDPLPGLHVIDATGSETNIDLRMEEFRSPVMPTGFVPANLAAYNGTLVWGYKDMAGQTATSYIGPVIVAERDVPTKIKFINNLGTTDTSLLPFWKTATDQTLHWADPNLTYPNPPLTPYSGPIPAVPHLHGGEIPPELDGGPDAWFYDPTLAAGAYAGYATEGHAYHNYLGAANDGSATYRYPNTQEAAPIWFHDHLLGMTRLNVYAGLAGAYLLIDPGAYPGNLPELIPLVIQDRMFDVDGELLFPNVGINPEHPFWIPEFVGDTIVVNGKVWPFKAVGRQRYQLLFLNGSNARAYDMFLQDTVSGVKGPPMWVIGTDGGYLDAPVPIDPNLKQTLVVMPGERYTVIVDFNDPAWLTSITNAYAAMTLPVPATLNLTLRNTARTPFPDGGSTAQSTTGRIIQFQVNMATPATDTSYDPSAVAATVRTTPMVRLPGTPQGAAINYTPGTENVQQLRRLTLNEVMAAGGPLEVLVNNTLWDGFMPGGTTRADFTLYTPPGTTEEYYYSEIPQEGQTEVWELINLTADAHPIHLHLVQFQLINRQVFDVLAYNAIYNLAFPGDAGTGLPASVYMAAWGPPLDYNTGLWRGATPAPLGLVTAGNKPGTADPVVGGNPDPAATLVGLPIPPLPQEEGWKDTVIAYPGEITRITVRWAPTDISEAALYSARYFPFNPDGGHGYVWHCHIIDHEDNEMMRPTQITAHPSTPTRTYTDY